MKPQNTIEVRCIECAKWSPKRCSEGMAKIGYGACDLHEPFICYPGDRLRDCASHISAEVEVVKARRTVIEMRDIPQRIAELETRAKQLVAPT